MKKLILTVALAAIAVTACKKTETTAVPETAATQTEAGEVSNMQETKTFTNSKGEILKVTYFAEGADVAVKIQKNSEPEHKLTAKKVSPEGNPIFTDDTYMWEMKEGGMGGRLSDKDGNATQFSAESK